MIPDVEVAMPDSIAITTDDKRAMHPAFILFSALIQPFIGIFEYVLTHITYSMITT